MTDDPKTDDKPHDGDKGFVDDVQLADSFSISSRHYLAPQHLWTALRNTRLCEELEAELLREHEVFHIQHRSYAVTAVLSAVAFLESLVNELFQDAVDVGPGPGSRAAPLDDQSVMLLSQFWQAAERYISPLNKYQMALLLCRKPRLDQGAKPFQNADYLVDIRNSIIHFKPETQLHGVQAKMERSIGDKFSENALMLGTTSPWFPDRCLGAGCARWACKSSVALAEAWSDALGLQREYETVLQTYPRP